MFFDATIMGIFFKFHFSIVKCSIIVQLMFIHWPCIQRLRWIQSLILIMFLINYLRFSLNMIIWHVWIKSSSQSFLLLALLYWLDPTSRMLKRCGESGHSCLVSIICGKGFKFSSLKTYKHFTKAFCQIEEAPCYSNSLRVFKSWINTEIYQMLFLQTLRWPQNFSFILLIWIIYFYKTD